MVYAKCGEWAFATKGLALIYVRIKQMFIDWIKRQRTNSIWNIVDKEPEITTQYYDLTCVM